MAQKKYSKKRPAKRPAARIRKRFSPANRWLSPLRIINFMLLFSIVGVVFLLLSQAAPLEGMYGSVEQDQVNRINSARASNGRGSLQHIECLNSIAEEWTKKMVSSGVLSHNPKVGPEVTGQCGTNWTIIAENVGVGYDSTSLFNAFMGSSGHKANILDSRSTKVGVGAYWSSAGKLWVTHVFAGCGTCTNAWGIPATLAVDPVATSPPPSQVISMRKPGDYNGDGKTDLAIYRPLEKNWYVYGIGTYNWGLAGDVPVPGDYNGDKKTDVAMWRPSDGNWFVKDQSTTQWGYPADIPVPGDYNGDGKTDLAVWRPSDGNWWVKDQFTTQWGLPGDVPVPGDYNGDKKTDLAIYRPSEKNWYIRGIATVNWGLPGDVPVPGDYNGDGKTDITMWRPSTGTWFVKDIFETQWGRAGDVPVPGDYNGDKKTDLAVWRPSDGNWWVKDQSTTQWGLPGDVTP